MGRRLRGPLVLSAVIAVALAMAGCGSSSSSSSPGTSGTSTSANTASALGTPNKATGTPITIGYISDGKGESVDNSNELAIAKATVQYVNDYLGGLAGHPITLDTCSTLSVAATATDCGLQMSNDHVPVVLNGVSGQAESFFKVLQSAKIPLVVDETTFNDILSTPGAAYVFTNGLGYSLAGAAGVARDAGVKRAAVVSIDVPGAIGPLKAVGVKFYANAGVKADIVGVPAGTADMTPQIQSEQANNPGLYALLGDPSFCTSALKALKTVGFTGTTVVIPNCIDASSQSAVPGGLKGIKVLSSIVSNPSDKDFELMQAIIDKYAKGTDPGGNGSLGFQTVLGFTKSMTGLTGDITSASITAAFAAMQPVALPLGGGIMLQCNGKQVTIAPNTCSSEVLSATYDANGLPTNYSVLQTSDLTKLG
jgi:branched-chain amino acid transport system substrate-binding protein